MNKIIRKASALLLLLLYVFSLFIGGETKLNDEKLYTGAAVTLDDAVATAGEVKISSRIYELLFGKDKSSDERVMLYPGGSVFGLLIKEEGVSVVSGTVGKSLLSGDKILGIDGVATESAAEVERIVKESGGRRLELEILRGGQRMKVNVTPHLVDGVYTLGTKLRSHTAGIGTITFIDPQSLSFGALGHGVSDARSGEYIGIKSGAVTPVTLGGCKKGEVGAAGELTGVLKQSTLGSISKNCECGVFGRLDSLPDYCVEPLPAATRTEVRSGAAEIISTVKNGKRATYKIEIYDVDYASSGSKSFKIKVTDPTLIAITGGIVRGMSGSPIIQDGKLVGAVTHVMVANPTEGYGIFIENMLNAAEEQAQPKAA